MRALENTTRARRAAAVHRRGNRLRAAGRLLAAQAAFREAARLFVLADGPSSADAAHAEVECAEIAELLGDLETAAAILKSAAARLAGQASRLTAPPDIQDLLLRVRLDTAQVSWTRGHYAAAERTCLSTLGWARRHPGPGQARVGAALNGLGVLRKAQGRYAEALACYRRALVIARKLPRSPSRTAEIATLYHNLAGSEHARGRLRQAEAHGRLGLTFRRRVASAGDPALPGATGGTRGSGCVGDRRAPIGHIGGRVVSRQRDVSPA